MLTVASVGMGAGRL